ncbi:preprotein translocase subunit SecA [Candidatus Roizmanbacteria bacterium RIFCSPLOWO2_01_FULL_41_22]|uniref:Protein translocase subunit SecA n=1 Tax=Candidatus Roizmanbacteria bacterium RIFCSPLOWO2_01_FULL_41_22 TaxID=1802067 RepID=A0A1F7JB39_9BACT|nr:MAG: preprotein translocase subunit SecA [Candidatus Roizmanbacteria bacterium RIFCSPLOWO2_01_FULL_41_22]
MFKFLKKLFDYNEKELARLAEKVVEINAQEDLVRDLSDNNFPKETQKLKKQITEGKSLDEVLPWAFALVREAARRTIGLRAFDTQLMAAIALHEGKIAEQKTGEGKTLTASMPLYLNALTGKGAHLVTVNDYLARRDAGWNGKIFHFLGFTTAAIISENSYLYDPQYKDSKSHDWRLANLKPISRRAAYEADITYGINSEFGFDYLRDNMVGSLAEAVQRGFHFAIIDEADSVLIDEARTPHIISAPYDEDTSKYYQYAKMVKQLDPKQDYIIDEKLRTAHLTEKGITHIEQILGVANVYEKDFDSVFHLEASLKAQTLFKVDKDYIVKDNEVIIVDEFTGRLLVGRRFSEGLHQAIEAKENVKIKQESKTLATVSLQNYFRMYEKLAGMTGTAATSAEEFNKIYRVDVIVVPTNKPMVRKDHPDKIYKTERGKFKAVVEEIAEQYKIGRPVLVGTTSIEKNEYLSHLLNQKGIPHELLNAKNHEREAQIIARAGEKSAITVATNMAGRGVDIILGGSQPEREISQTKADFNKEMQTWQENHDEVVRLGGLYVLGTERHEARTIDNQLRGRSGRQGDPGVTRFYVSLEDDLMRIFGGEQISKLMTFFNFPEDQPLSHSMVSKAIEQAQVKVEGFNFDIRKHLVEFDDVLNKQRDIIYSLRRKMLALPEENAEKFRETVMETVSEEISSVSSSYFSLQEQLTSEETENFVKDLQVLFPVSKSNITKYLSEKNQSGLQEYLFHHAESEYKNKEISLGRDLWNQIIRSIFLSTIDQYWTQHLTAIEDLREGINLRGYAQLDPLVEYKNEAFSMFEKLISDVDYEAIRRVLRVQVEKKSEPTLAPQPASDQDKPIKYSSASAINPYVASQQDSTIQTTPQSPAIPASGGYQPARKLGRNNKCWCGSGKKYKKCHLNQDLAGQRA